MLIAQLKNCLKKVGYWVCLGGIVAMLGYGLTQWLSPTSLGNVALASKSPTQLDMLLDEPISPIPLSINLNRQKVALGKRLFFEVDLSNNGQMSCATCHPLEQAGVDGYPRALGSDGQPLALNTPTVFNSGFNFRQFWDGRAATLEEQVDGPLLSPTEMNANWSDVLVYLNQEQQYLNDFKRIYHAAPDETSVRDAIATFQRSLITPNSRFDQFLRGQSNALTEDEKQGYKLFKAYGCAACHQGVNVGGNLYQRLGVAKDYFMDRGDVHTVDMGRLNLTGRNRDRYVFKVPSLRNIELTAPYFHDGSIPTLEAAVEIMAIYQLGREIPLEDATQMVQFLKTLTGEIQF